MSRLDSPPFSGAMYATPAVYYNSLPPLPPMLQTVQRPGDVVQSESYEPRLEDETTNSIDYFLFGDKWENLQDNL